MKDDQLIFQKVFQLHKFVEDLNLLYHHNCDHEHIQPIHYFLNFLIIFYLKHFQLLSIHLDQINIHQAVKLFSYLLFEAKIIFFQLKLINDCFKFTRFISCSHFSQRYGINRRGIPCCSKFLKSTFYDFFHCVF